MIRHRVRPRLIAPVVARPMPPSLRLAPVFLREVEERLTASLTSSGK